MIRESAATVTHMVCWADGRSWDDGHAMSRWLAVSALAAVVLGNAPAQAQNWPTRPLTLVVPFAAGGPSDVAGRIIAQRLGEVLGQQVVVDNPSGAGGTVGSTRVSKAPPDGY